MRAASPLLCALVVGSLLNIAPLVAATHDGSGWQWWTDPAHFGSDAPTEPNTPPGYRILLTTQRLDSSGNPIDGSGVPCAACPVVFGDDSSNPWTERLPVTASPDATRIPEVGVDGLAPSGHTSTGIDPLAPPSHYPPGSVLVGNAGYVDLQCAAYVADSSDPSDPDGMCKAREASLTLDVSPAWTAASTLAAIVDDDSATEGLWFDAATFQVGIAGLVNTALVAQGAAPAASSSLECLLAFTPAATPPLEGCPSAFQGIAGTRMPSHHVFPGPSGIGLGSYAAGNGNADRDGLPPLAMAGSPLFVTAQWGYARDLSDLYEAAPPFPRGLGDQRVGDLDEDFVDVLGRPWDDTGAFYKWDLKRGDASAGLLGTDPDDQLAKPARSGLDTPDEFRSLIDWGVPTSGARTSDGENGLNKPEEFVLSEFVHMGAMHGLFAQLSVGSGLVVASETLDSAASLDLDFLETPVTEPETPGTVDPFADDDGDDCADSTDDLGMTLEPPTAGDGRADLCDRDGGPLAADAKEPDLPGLRGSVPPFTDAIEIVYYYNQGYELYLAPSFFFLDEAPGRQIDVVTWVDTMKNDEYDRTCVASSESGCTKYQFRARSERASFVDDYVDVDTYVAIGAVVG